MSMNLWIATSNVWIFEGGNSNVFPNPFETISANTLARFTGKRYDGMGYSRWELEYYSNVTNRFGLGWADLPSFNLLRNFAWDAGLVDEGFVYQEHLTGHWVSSLQ